ncbi:MAG: hypothetical protein ACSHW9_00255 [Salinibacterium amurskyense]
MTFPFLSSRLNTDDLSSLEWKTLWQCSINRAVLRENDEGHSLSFVDTPLGTGNHSAAIRLIAEGFLVTSPGTPTGRFVDQHLPLGKILSPSRTGWRALRSPEAAAFKPTTRTELQGLRNDLDREDQDLRALWLLQLRAPVRFTPDGLLEGRGWWGDESKCREGIVALLDKGLAEKHGQELVITPSGVDALAQRPQLTSGFEALRRVYAEHHIDVGTPEHYEQFNVAKNQGLYVCSCGWYTIYDDPLSYRWAGEYPAGAHPAQLYDQQYLAVTREVEGKA